MSKHIQERADRFAATVRGRIAATLRERGIAFAPTAEPITIADVAVFAEHAQVDPRVWFTPLVG